MRHDTLSPTRLSNEPRTARSPDITRRRWAIDLALSGTAIGAVVTAYQTGLIDHLPDIRPGAVFDSDKVDASDYAYKRTQVPDAALMVVTYGSGGDQGGR